MPRNNQGGEQTCRLVSVVIAFWRGCTIELFGYPACGNCKNMAETITHFVIRDHRSNCPLEASFRRGSPGQINVTIIDTHCRLAFEARVNARQFFWYLDRLRATEFPELPPDPGPVPK